MKKTIVTASVNIGQIGCLLFHANFHSVKYNTGYNKKHAAPDFDLLHKKLHNTFATYFSLINDTNKIILLKMCSAAFSANSLNANTAFLSLLR